MDSMFFKMDTICNKMESIIQYKLISTFSNMKVIFLKMVIISVKWPSVKKGPHFKTWNPFFWHGDFPLSKFSYMKSIFPFRLDNSDGDVGKWGYNLKILSKKCAFFSCYERSAYPERRATLIDLKRNRHFKQMKVALLSRICRSLTKRKKK